MRATSCALCVLACVLLFLGCSKDNPPALVSIGVSQDGEEVLEITISSIAIEQEFDVKAQGGVWDLKEEIEWLEATKISEEKLNIKVEENVTHQDRSGKVTLLLENVEREIRVIQKAAPTLTISSTDIDLPFYRGNITLDITTSEGEWTAERKNADDTWITNLERLEDNTQLKISYASNSEASIRTAILVVRIQNLSISEEITLNQNQVATLTILPDESIMGLPSSMGEVTLDVTASEGEWVVERKNAGDTWITNLEILEGNTKLKISYASNSETSVRTAILVVKIEDSDVSEEITVVQMGQFLSISKLMHTAPSDEGYVTLDVITHPNATWTASKQPGDTWITNLEDVDSNNNMLKITYNANDQMSQRTAVITITVAEFMVGSMTINSFTSDITLTQMGNLLRISESMPTVPADAGNITLDMTVHAGTTWTASKQPGDTWITNLEDVDSNNNMLKITYDANAETSLRTAVITITVAEFTVGDMTINSFTSNITLTQMGTFLSISESMPTVPSDEGYVTLDITIHPSATWTASKQPGDTWITNLEDIDSNNNMLKITYNANDQMSQRTAVITITVAEFMIGDMTINSFTSDVTLTQMGNLLRISESMPTVTGDAGDITLDMTVHAGTTWTASKQTDDTWITNLEDVDSNNNMLKITYDANTETSQRTAVITITVAEFTVGSMTINSFTSDIMLTQIGKLLSISESMPTLTADAGHVTLDVIAHTGTTWTASKQSGDTWITNLEDVDNNNNMLKITYDVHAEAAQRTAVITITVAEFTVGDMTISSFTSDITLTQSQPQITITNSSINLSRTNGTMEISGVSAEGPDWTAMSSDSWLTITSQDAMAGTINISYTENTIAGLRSATITFMPDIYASESIEVRQVTDIEISSRSIENSGGDAFLELFASAIDTTLTVTSDVTWVVEEASGWITTDIANGDNANEKQLTLRVKLYDGSTRSVIGTAGHLLQRVNSRITAVDREAVITLKTSDNAIQRTFKVIQRGPECITTTGEKFIMYEVPKEAGKYNVRPNGIMFHGKAQGWLHWAMVPVEEGGLRTSSGRFGTSSNTPSYVEVPKFNRRGARHPNLCWGILEDPNEHQFKIQLEENDTGEARTFYLLLGPIHAYKDGAQTGTNFGRRSMVIGFQQLAE